MTEPTAPGWYPDPENPAQQRYWDGSAWIERVAQGGVPLTPPSAAAKKPIYKRPWAIVLAVLIGLGVISNMVSGSPSTPPASSPTVTESTPQAAEPEVQPEPVEAEPEPIEEPAEPQMSMGEQQAVEKAEAYLEMGGFSRKGLIGQLKYEGFSKAEATFAVDFADPDWNEQAAAKAQGYLDMGGFSRKRLIEQLEYEGFTEAQAKYGAKAVGY